MFRSFLNISRIVSLHRSAIVVRSYSQHTLKHVSNLFDTSFEYFHKNPKYTIYNPNDRNLYEFDAETRGLTPSNILNNTEKSIPWTDLAADCTHADLISALKNVCDYCCETKTSLSSEQFDSFVDEMATQLPKFTSNETICALQLFAQLEMDNRSYGTRNFAELIIGLDQASTINAAEWDINQVLYAGSIWCTIPAARKTFFAKFLGRHFNKFAKLMTPEQLAQSICYLHTLKRPVDDVRSFENVFERNIEVMTPIELSIVCQNFVRMDATLEKPELREKLFKFLMERDLNELRDMMLRNILCVVQTSVNGGDANLIDALQTRLLKTISKRSARECVLIADLGSFVQLSNNEIIEYTLNRCVNEPNVLETFVGSDLERLSRIIGMLNFTSESGIEMAAGKVLLQELRNRIEHIVTNRFHQKFLKILVNLSQADIYDVELLENTLRSDCLRFHYGLSKQFPSDIYMLDAYARLNLAGIYKGDLLSEVHLGKLGKYLSDYLPNDTTNLSLRQNAQYLADVANCVEKVFQHFTYAHATSHFRRPDIFVGIDKTTGQAIDVSHRFPPPYTGQMISAAQIIGDDPNLEIYAFSNGYFRSFEVKSKRPMGIMRQRLQQLKLLGFHAILIPQSEWLQLEDEKRPDYVYQKFQQKFREIRSADVDGRMKPVKIDE